MNLFIICLLLNIAYLFSSENPPAYNPYAKRELLELLKRQPSLSQPLINNSERSEDEIIQHHSPEVENQFQTIEPSAPYITEMEDLAFLKKTNIENCIEQIKKLNIEKWKIIEIFASKDNCHLIFILHEEIIMWDCNKQKKVRHIYSSSILSCFKSLLTSSKNKIKGYILSVSLSPDGSLFLTHHAILSEASLWNKEEFFLLWDNNCNLLKKIDTSLSLHKPLLEISKDNSKLIRVHKSYFEVYVNIHNIKKNDSINLVRKDADLGGFVNVSLSPDKSKLALLYMGRIQGLLIVDLGSLECIFLLNKFNSMLKYYHTFNWTEDSNYINFYYSHDKHNIDEHNIVDKIKVCHDLNIEFFNDLYIRFWNVSNKFVINENSNFYWKVTDFFNIK